MAEITTGGGGLNQGQPINWPAGKPTSAPVGAPQDPQTAGGVRGVPGRAAPARPTESTPSTSPGQIPTAAPPKPAPTIARPLTIEDIRSHLLSLQVEPNDFNSKLASLMLRSGLEVSGSNFMKLLNMMQGTNKSQAMQEASILLLMKGIDSPEAAKVLGQYFSENPELANQLTSLQSGLGNLVTSLGLGKSMLNASFISQLSALLAQFDKTLQEVAGKFSSDGKIFNLANMLNDVRAIKALMQGIQDKSKTPEGKEMKTLASSIKELQAKLNNVEQNLIAQGILSQHGRSDVNYHYQQIPNAMTTPPKDFEIMIKRDSEGKQGEINPKNTNVVMSLETENVGKMVISMIVKDNKVYVIFVFSEKEYGDKGREIIARDFGELQKKLTEKNFMISGYQVKVDRAMCEIKPYLIPIITKLEDILKKIDFEA
ncbi:MAG: hypothetical protein WCV91_00500 [Candidatus Margulisiibacteriota bacterium]